MPRYFFHVFDGRDFPDRDGTLLRGDAEVRIHMLALSSTWLGLERGQKTYWSLEARNDADKIVGSMVFGVKPGSEGD